MQMVSQNPPTTSKTPQSRNSIPINSSLPSTLIVANSTATAMQQQPKPCSSGNARTWLDEVDQLVLARLCVLNQSDYTEGKKGEFWDKISILLKWETRKRLKNPASTMKSLVAGHRITVDAERLESGTTQADTQLTQVLDIWIEWLNMVEKERLDTKKIAEDLMHEIQEAERCRENLLKLHGQKKKLGDRDGNGKEEEDLELVDSKRKKRSRSSMWEEQRQKEMDMVYDDTSLLVSAIQDMSTQMSGAIWSLNSNSFSEVANSNNVEEQKEQGRWQEEMLGSEN
ncbi:hypothetical protein L873DRAFT_1843682 [Choiromyces venosus 120613-1]|uniref:Uncharacterized protein n=1 Tax=Choiromyces venosus 120613-1 TaxID=1336337 RepID=A0A3N4JMC7_9PEZI|nr:hypothetical protein L873DRAFT_1843682 [Choiromyces venosus 120613-1]